MKLFYKTKDLKRLCATYMYIYVSIRYIAVTESRNMATVIYFTNLDGCYLVIHNHFQFKIMLETFCLSYPVLELH